MRTINRPIYTPGIEPAPREMPIRDSRKRNFFLGQNEPFQVTNEMVTGLVAGGLLLLFILGRKK